MEHLKCFQMRYQVNKIVYKNVVYFMQKCLAKFSFKSKNSEPIKGLYLPNNVTNIELLLLNFTYIISFLNEETQILTIYDINILMCINLQDIFKWGKYSLTV